MLSSIVIFFKFLPDIMNAVKAVITIIKDYQKKVEEKKRLETLEKAIQNAKSTKDTRDLEAVFNNSALDF